MKEKEFLQYINIPDRIVNPDDLPEYQMTISDLIVGFQNWLGSEPCEHPDAAVIRDQPTPYCLVCRKNI